MPGIWNAFRTDKVTVNLSVVKGISKRSKNIAKHETVIENTNISRTYGLVSVLLHRRLDRWTDLVCT
jgi:hypothetical protein